MKPRLLTGVCTLCLSLVVLLVADSCRRESAQEPQAHIKIGVLAPFNTQPGEGIRSGAKMAVDEINLAGGINGRKMEIVEINTEYSPEKSLRGYQRLAGQDKVAAVIGVADDGIFAIMEQLHRYKTPMITTGCGADRLTEMVSGDPERYKWFFRVMHKSSELGEVTADFAINCLSKKHGIKKFALMVEDDIWTKYIRDIWVRQLSQNSETKIVYNSTFSPQADDFSVIFQQITDSGAQYIFDACSQVDATTYLKRWAVVNAPPIGAIPTGAGTKRYFDLIGDKGLYVTSIATIPSEQNPLTQLSAVWAKKHRQLFGDAAYTTGYSYDAVYILVDALRRAGTTDSDALTSALEKTDHPGVVARWAFGPDHHPRYGHNYREITIIQYTDPSETGFHIIWPPDRAAADYRFPPGREAKH